MPISFLNRLLGQYRRHRGLYDKTTLRFFVAAWACSGSPADLLRYALFRRDLGKRLPSRWVGMLLAALPDFSASERRLALGLLAEIKPECLQTIDRPAILDGIQLPAVASRILNRPDRFLNLAEIDLNQSRWQNEFADQLRSAQLSGGLAVVGNAATLNGLRLGVAIDLFDLTVRFNHFMGHADLAEDIGRRTDVWVVSPGYVGPLPESASWVVMTGPDMRYRLSDWRRVMPLLERGVPVLTIPLMVWEELVGILGAPPSAGILVLAWLKSLSDSGWQGISIAGIGSGLAKGGRYHASLSRHRAVGRHAWEREARLVAAWRQNGLATVMNRELS